ncbi:MAG: PAS domain S-box protein [Patescibacteria group bacterium]
MVKNPMDKYGDLGKLLRSIVGEMHEGVQIIDRKWRFVYVNDAAARHGRCTKKQLLGRTLMACYPGIEKSPNFSKFKRCMEKRVHLKFENEYVFPDSSRGWYELYVHPVDEGVLVLSFDITEQKLAMQRLKESEHKFKALVDKSLVGVYLIQDGVFKYVNPVLAKVFGYKVSDIINKMGPRDFTAISDRAIVEENIRRRIRGEVKTVHYRFNGITRRKKIIRLEVLGSRTVFDGKPAIIGSLFDVTSEEQKDLELKQRTEELQRIKMAVEGASDEVAILDLSGHLLFANAALCRMTGYSLKEIVGKKPWESWLKTEEPLDYEKTLGWILTEKKPWVGEYVNHRKNGETYTSRTTLTPIMDKKGKPIFLVGVGMDVSKENEINRMKTEFVSLASHQMRTPLTGIKWIVDLMLSEKSDKLSFMQEKMLRDINQMNERLIRLVNDLLDVSRIETGRRFEINIQRGDIANTVKNIVTDLKAMAKDKQIKVEFSRPMPKQLMCSFDESKIHQVLTNLLSNAIDYSRPGSKVIVGCRQAAGEIVCSVKDYGIGIPKHQQKRVFEKFFRADNAYAIKTNGSGLGLYIAKTIIEGHGGRIWFVSHLGKGTTFHFSLPL